MMPLPRLKVLRETYCSQQVVDTAVDFVEVHRPELIEKLMAEEHWRQQGYSERAWDIIEYLTKEKVEIPTSLIWRMDLINEFTRRGRSAYGRPEISPKGKPLVSGPDQPLPPLVKLDINERTRKHITQEVADSFLQTAYERRPDLWLAFSEEHRHEVLLDAIVQFRVLLRQVLDEHRPGENNMRPEMDLYHEALGRIFRMWDTVTVPLTLMNNLERIPVRVEDICGVIAGVVFEARARRNIILRAGSDGRRNIADSLAALLRFDSIRMKRGTIAANPGE
jgi:hypothetical protein